MTKAKKDTPAVLTVVARNAGHYGERHIREGQTFELAARTDFAASWMTPVDWDPNEDATAETKTNTET